MDLRLNIVTKQHAPIDLHIQHNFYLISADFFAETDKLILKFIQKFKGTRKAKSSHKKAQS